MGQANAIFEAVMKASERMHILCEIQDLQQSITDSENTCGSCQKWMTKQCAREKHHMVSCNERKCSDFAIGRLDLKRIEKQMVGIENLKANL